MNFIIENYVIIIAVGLFFVFALIGYLIEMLRDKKTEEKEIIPNNMNYINSENPTILNNIEHEDDQKKVENNILDSADNLLQNYNEEIDNK